MIGFAPIGAAAISASHFDYDVVPTLVLIEGVRPEDIAHATYEFDASINADYEQLSTSAELDGKMKVWEAKDPDEIRDRGFNWTPRNIGEAKIISILCQVVVGSVVAVSSTIGSVLSSRADQGTIHRFSGGTAGTTNTILLTATLDDGQKLQQTVLLPIRNN